MANSKSKDNIKTKYPGKDRINRKNVVNGAVNYKFAAQNVDCAVDANILPATADQQLLNK